MYFDENGKRYHSPETIAKMRAKREQFWKDKTLDERREILAPTFEGAKIGLQRRYENTTPEQRAQMVRPMIDAGIAATREKWDSMNAEERSQYLQYLHSHNSELYASMSKEEKREFFRPRTQAGSDALKFKDTKPELQFKALLDEKGLIEGTHYLREQRIDRYRVDFLIFPYQIYEVFGCFHHQCKKCGHVNGYWSARDKFVSPDEQWIYDAQRKAYLENEGYTVKIIWSHSLNHN